MIIVQRSFALIHKLPDNILRWLSGGHAASFGGEEASSMVQETKGAVSGQADRSAQFAAERFRSDDLKGKGAKQKIGGGDGGGKTGIQQGNQPPGPPPKS